MSVVATDAPVAARPVTRLPVAARFALRELRGGLRGFYVFLACIALGVAAIAGVNSVARALSAGIAAEGRAILSGDLAFSLVGREASAEEREVLASLGSLDVMIETRAMARRADGTDQALVELKAVGDQYPRIGSFVLAGGGPLAEALGQRDGTFGAVAAPALLEALGLKPGDRIALGEATLTLSDTIVEEPDRLFSGIGFGPRLLISDAALAATGLVRPGSLATWHYRVALPQGGSVEAAAALVKERLPDAGWRVRTRDDASPGLNRNIERFAQFLTLVGLTALVVGGVGVANAVTSFVDLKRRSIATLKCLGASSRTVFATYATQVLIVACVGILLGLAVGAAIPFLAREALADLLPVRSAPALFPLELMLAALFGLLVTAAFALGPLARASRMPATHLFADRALGSPERPPLSSRAAQGAAFLALAGLALLLSDDRRLALIYIGATLAAFIVLRLVASGVMALAARAGRVRGTALRLAIRNIHRPGALTPSVVLSLGLGLTLLVALALIEASLRGQLAGEIREAAPDYFFLDVQRAEAADFAAALARAAPGGEIARVPMLRGRITSLNGVPVERIVPPDEARWVLRGDRGITFSGTLPENSRLVSGAWWAPDHSGEPLVSFDDEIARALNLQLGDAVEVNVLGRTVTARLANTRVVDWESLSINFVMVFSPNTFAGAPFSELATLRLPEGARPEVRQAVMSTAANGFPGVTAIDVGDALASVNALVGQLATAVRAAASITLVVSMLVLAGALAAGHRQRRQDAVILKALGATRKKLLAAFALEYGLLGAAAALFAVLAGSVAAWFVVAQVMDLDFAFRPGVAAGAILIALAVTIGLGLAGTWRILSVRPAPFLRNL